MKRYEINYIYRIIVKFNRGDKMTVFPIILNIEKKNIIIIGGGKVATEKVKRLLNFTKNITILSPDLTPELREIILKENLVYIPKKYSPEFILNFEIIVVAVNDLKLQEEIYKEAKKNNKLCNVVDVPEYSDFLFPSIVKKGDLIVAFSTSGDSPAFSKYLRQFFERVIPDEVVNFLDEMKKLRKKIPKGKKRQEILDKKAKDFFDKHFKL